MPPSYLCADTFDVLFFVLCRERKSGKIDSVRLSFVFFNIYTPYRSPASIVYDQAANGIGQLA